MGAVPICIVMLERGREGRESCAQCWLWKQGLTERCQQLPLFPEEPVRFQLWRAKAILLRLP